MVNCALGVAVLALSGSISEDRPLERWLGYFAVPGMVLAEVEVVSWHSVRDLQHCGERIERREGKLVPARSSRCDPAAIEITMRVLAQFHPDGPSRVGKLVRAATEGLGWSPWPSGDRGLVALADPRATGVPRALPDQFNAWSDLHRTIYYSSESGAHHFAAADWWVESWLPLEEAGRIIEALRRGPPAFALVEPADGAIVEGEVPVVATCAANAADEVRLTVLGGPRVVLPVVEGRGSGHLDLSAEDGPLYLGTEFRRQGQVVATLRSELLAANRRPWRWTDVGGVGFANARGPGTDRPPLRGGACGDEVCAAGDAAACPRDCPEIVGAVTIRFRPAGERTVDFEAAVSLPPGEVVESYEWWFGNEESESLPAPRFTFDTGGVHVVSVRVETSIGRLTASTAVDLEARRGSRP